MLFLVEPTSAGIAKGIAAALSPSSEPQQKAARAQKLYERRYSRQIYKDKMREVFAYLEGKSTASPLQSTADERKHLVKDRGDR